MRDILFTIPKCKNCQKWMKDFFILGHWFEKNRNVWPRFPPLKILSSLHVTKSHNRTVPSSEHETNLLSVGLKL